MDRGRAQLVAHVREIQRSVRTCEGCGLCCTEEYNSVRILHAEARRIADHLRELPAERRSDLTARVRAAISRFGLTARAARQRYTCPFLEADFSCALPFEVKPVACLAFNPISEDRCDMDVERFQRAHAACETLNAKTGNPDRRVPIPVAVISALDAKRDPPGSRDRRPGPPATGEGFEATPSRPTAARASRPAERPHPLPRLLSKWNFASRREAEDLVRSGHVTVNGAVVRDLVRRVDPARDRIAIDGTPVEPPPAGRAFAYVVLNKPRGVVTTTSDPDGRPTVMGLLADRKAPGLAPVGRLDQDSAGLILLTNDHELAARLLDPKSHVAKVYRVKVKRHVTPETLARMQRETVEVDGLRLAPFSVEVESVGPRSTWLRIRLEEGKNRQIRRQCAAFGHEVEMIVRMTFGPLELGALKPGACRVLGAAEVAVLRKARR